MDQLAELGLDSGLPTFEPQQRARSNTWPLPRPDDFTDKDDVGNIDGKSSDAHDSNHPIGGASGPAPKKTQSRRNAWGNMSYAELITQAITSAPDKRLTLSQIYDWMVQNISYFNDKGDSNSSAGWKNSIRHNLSLHNRFMRVLNEGAGKSSWWMINPDAKPGKAARRRATSMETQKFEKRRGRVKKNLDLKRAANAGLAIGGINCGMPNEATPSPSSSVSEGLDMYPDSPVLNNNNSTLGGCGGGGGSATFQLSPDFRPRASSNASSCSRLSPIPALEQDNQAPLSPISWNNDMVSMYNTGGSAPPPAYPADLDNVKLCDSIAEAMTIKDPLPLNTNAPYSSFYNSTPPLYTELSSARSLNLDSVSSGLSLSRGKLEPREVGVGYCNGGLSRSAGVKPPPTIPESHEPPSVCPSGPSSVPSAGGNLLPLSPLSNLAPSLASLSPMAPPAASQVSSTRSPPSHLVVQQQQQQHQQQQQQPQLKLEPGVGCSLSALGGVALQLRGHLPIAGAGGADCADLNLDTLDTLQDTLQGGLECDVDQVIRHELSVDGTLDFNFTDSGASVSNQVHLQSAPPGSRSWVH